MTAPPLRVVLYEGAGATALATAEKIEILEKLLGAGYTVRMAGCPCEIAEGSRGPTAVLGRFEKEMPQRMAGDELVVLFRDLRDPGAQDLLEALRRLAGEAGARAPGGWIPWFPVIDRGRCNDCMRCMSFCLFGVYEAAGKRVEVVRPENCKTNCPACARICPQTAIIFPKCAESPIDGAEVRPEDVSASKAGKDLDALLKANIYDLLRSRSAGPAGAMGPAERAPGGQEEDA